MDATEQSSNADIKGFHSEVKYYNQKSLFGVNFTNLMVQIANAGSVQFHQQKYAQLNGMHG
jgi:hypothetical protein